jgi:hypothetical protein
LALQLAAVNCQRDSCQQLLHDFAVDIGQSEIAALEAERQPRVIEAQQVQNRGVQIVHVHGFRGDVES